MFTILIGTCDKYNHLWDTFVHLFNKYWDHSIQCDKIFLSETLAPKYDGFTSLTPGKIPYTECLTYALNNIQSPYVLWLQDDYFLRRKISKGEFETYMSFIKLRNLDRFGIHEDSEIYVKSHIQNNIYKFAYNSTYLISMQASIWKKKFFKSCIGPAETPWQFETDGPQRLVNKDIAHSIYFKKLKTPWYVEGMKKGEFTEDYHKVKLQENLK